MTPLSHTLAELVRINSVNSFYEGGPGEAELANYVSDFFDKHGIQHSRQAVLPGRDNVIGCLPGKQSGKRIILEAHMDTVSIAGMSIPPFEPHIESGRLHGRGACDTKAGLAAMLHALVDLKRSGIQPACEIWLAAVVDEEYSFRGVVELCKGLSANAAIVAEPTELRAVIASKGVLRWRMIAHGKSAHSSKTHLGINAIYHMARVILAIEHEQLTLAAHQHPLLGSASVNVGRIAGGVQVNFVPDQCAIEIDRRLLPHESVAQVLQSYQQLLDQLQAAHPDFVVRMETPMLVDEALDTAAESQVAGVASTILRDMGLNDQPAGVPFGSDASKLSRAGVPSIIFGPGSIDQAHAAVEYVDLDQVEQACEFFRRFLRQFE
jgi:acetylornithine deacetylase/succinyl-diaminopimelate desuccinylase family protein